MFPSDAIGYKKFHDCKETLVSAFLHFRQPLTFNECIGPILKAENERILSNEVCVAESIVLGQLKNEDGIQCVSGISPYKKFFYKSNQTYETSFGGGIWYYKTLQKAISNYIHIKNI